MKTSRHARKNRTDIEIKGWGGITDIYDDMVKQMWRINDEEYDYIASQSDEVLDAFTLTDKMSFSEIKNSIRIINETLDKYYESWKK